jgi:hypothetical protein
MVVSLLLSILSIKSDNSIASRKSHTKVQFVTYCGQTLMTDADGVFLPEVLVTLSVRIYPSSLTMQMVSNWYLVLIS